MSGSGKDDSPTPAPSGPGRGRPKKVRPRENEAGSGTGIGIDVKRRRKSSTAAGETSELVSRTTGALDENDTNEVELKDPDPPITRSGARSEKHPMSKGKQNSVKSGGSDDGIGLVHEHGRNGESQEEEKDAALEVVLTVHGVCAQAAEGAAAFPGETGEEIGGLVHLCACCMKPEVLKMTLVCDGCDRSFHVTCLELDSQSAFELDDWICTSCAAAYPESEVTAGVPNTLQEDIERKLFSLKRKTCGVQDEPRGTVCSGLDDHQLMVDVTASSEQIPQDLNQVSGTNVTDDDDHRQDSSNHIILLERPFLDLNEVNDEDVECSPRRKLEIDLNEIRPPEFEEEVLKVDESSNSPEAEAFAVKNLVLPDRREPRTNSMEPSLERNASKGIESSERVERSTIEEFSGVIDVEFPSAAGSFRLLDTEVPCNMRESSVHGIKSPTIAEATSIAEAKVLGSPEGCVIAVTSRPMLFPAKPRVESEKLAATSVAEELTTMADSKLLITSEEYDVFNKNRLSNFSAELVGGNEENLAGYSVGGDLMPVVQLKLLERQDGREISRECGSVIPSVERTTAEELNKACTVVVASDAASMAVASGRLLSAVSRDAACVDSVVTDVLHEDADIGNCITGDDLGQGGKLTTKKYSDKKEKRARKNGSKHLEHFQEGIVALPGITGERVEISEAEPASHNPVVASSPTSSAEVVVVQPECQQSKKAANKIPSTVSHGDRASCINVDLNGSLAGKPTEETSPSGPDDQQLKRIGADTLQQLRDAIREKHGVMLAEGWEVEVRRRRNEKHLDKYYISPEKCRFRSRIEVMKHLGLWDGLKVSSQDGSKGKCEVQQRQPKDWLTMAKRVVGDNAELRVPLKLGDLTLEALGVVDLRPGYWDDLHIWPVGYRCTWHDRTTSSFCVCEVTEGGSSAPIFRVTRKYCPTIFGLPDSRGDAVNVKHDKSDMAMKNLLAVREDIMAASVDTMASSSHDVKGQYGSSVDAEEEESLKALLGDVGSFASSIHHENMKLCRDSRNLDETSNIGTEVVLEGLEPRDAIGEFSVEALTTAEVWRLYAEQLVERCRKVSDDFGSAMKPCPHKAASVGPSPVEVLDARDLVEKLGEDRFGLNQALVIGLIETLPNVEKCSGYKSLKQRGLSCKSADLVEGTVQPPRFRIREKGRKPKKAFEVPVEESVLAGEPVEVNCKDEVDGPVLLGKRPPPPGQSLELRLPSQYVGDVLQIWEFLSRFSNLIGFSEPPMLEDLEECLNCGSASVSGCVDQSDFLHIRSEIRAFDKKPESDGRREVSGEVKVTHTAPRSTTREATGSPHTPMKNLRPGCANLASFRHGTEEKDAGRTEHLWEDDGKAVGSPSNDANSFVDIEPSHDKGDALSADVYPKISDANSIIDEPGFTSAASVHVPLIKFLIADLQSKVCGFEECPGESDELKHKRGRKRIRDIVATASLGREKLTGSFSINELTWPEVARRYILSPSRVPEVGDTAEYRREECMKILRCIQGDGGVLCGALDGVAGMEIDAQLLAEAEKEISTLMLGNEETAAPTTPPQKSLSRGPVEDARDEDSSGETALWVKLLDPIAKLPTNVGSRIRNRVIDSLAANPPAWAAEMLEYSISKKVYKGNASGPTKRAVMEVLQRYRGEEPDPKVKKTKKQRKRVLPSPEVVMQRCRIVLRQVATADTLRVVSKSYRCMTNFYESEGEGLLARPLDFRAIDLRLGAGAYGTSPDSFAADVKQIWKNVALLNEKGNVEASAAIQLAELFNSLYNKQVIVFQRGGDQASVTGPDAKSNGMSNEESQKKASEAKPPGSDPNKPVKAPWEDDSCQVCGIDDDHDNVLLCDGCDAEYHIYCLNPPLAEVPDGNWFCHSCVAVDNGFLEAPSVPGSATETKAPDKQHENHQMRGHFLEERAEKDQLRKLGGSTHSSLNAVVLKLAETDYWHLTLAERVQLLKWLCDQALETPRLRSHLEKSMEVALDLQQNLRTLLAERRRNADLLDEARPESFKEGSREVSILSALQSRGAISKRPDEFDAGISVQVDVVDGLSVSGPSTAAVETSRVLRSDPTQFVWPEEHASVVTGVDSLREPGERRLSAKHSRSEQEEKDVAADHSRNNPVLDPVEVDLADSAVRGNCGQVKDASDGETPVFNREWNVESDNVNVVDSPDIVFSEKNRKNAENPIRANPQLVVEPRNLFTSFDEGVESRRKCPKDEHLSCPEVEVQIEDNTSQRNGTSLLDAEIEKINTKLMLLNTRRDLLGRDDMGRIYWALCGSKTTPWLAVETNDHHNPYQPVHQELVSRAKVGMAVDSSALFPSVKWDKDDDSRKRHTSNGLGESADGSPTDVRKKEEKGPPSTEGQTGTRDYLSWLIYTNEGALDQLIEWLSPTSNQERLLTATLLQWKSLLLVCRDGGAEQPGGLRDLFARLPSTGNGIKATDTQALASQDVYKSRRSVMPVLKASSLLEWKYGQFSDSLVKVSSNSGGSKRGRKRKTQMTSKISRCECLEPLWASRCHCMLCHTTYESEMEFQAHKTSCSFMNTGGKAFDQHGDGRAGKKPFLNSKSLSSTKSLKSAFPEQSPAGIHATMDVSKMPMVVHETLRDRINRIGCIADKGPLFAPGLVVSPAFDPALMMVDSSVTAGGLSNARGILKTVAVGATSCINHIEGENLVNGNWILVSSSETLPARQVEGAEGAEAVYNSDHASGRTYVATAGSPAPEHGSPFSLNAKGFTTKEEVKFNQCQSAVSAVSLGSALRGALDLPHEPNGQPSQYKGYCRNFKVTGKQLTISEASLRPLEAEEDLDVLQQLKMKLLDIEATITPDMSEKARAYPRRRQAWRSMLKSAKSIYTVVQVILLLEQMICADFLRTSWCYWSSFTVAAKTATLSSLFLRVYALDAAIAYEKSENYTGADVNTCGGKQARQDKDKDKKNCQHLKPPRKKKKEDVIVVS